MLAVPRNSILITMPYEHEIDELEYALDALEYRYAEFDGTEGRTLHGTLMRYGDVSTRTPTGIKERFEPQAFGDVANSDILLNVQHDRRRPLARTGEGGLILTDSPEQLTIAATLPETREADDTLELVEKGILTGFSPEFHARRQRFDGGTRVIEKALMPAIGVVDIPAFDDSAILEIRAGNEGIEGEFAYGADAIISATGRIRKEQIAPGAFTYAIAEPTREINLVLGDNSRPLASKISGSLKIEDTPTALKFKVEKLPRTSYVADFLSMLRSKSVTPGVLPLFSPTPRSVARRLFANGKAVEEEPEEGNPSVFRRIVRSGLLTALSILFRPRRGNPGSVTTLPTRLRRPLTGTGVVGGVRPQSGDIIRNTARGKRVIRDGQDIGPLAVRSAVWL